MKSNRFLLSNILTKGSMMGSAALFVLIFACNEKPKAETSILKISTSDSVRKKYTAEMIDNKKDPSCGMPMSAGIEDTVHYKGKVYGFCSDECKQIFLKNPNTLAKNAEMKN
jgi:YHS domain-containing protein